MNPEDVLAVLPDGKDGTMSMEEIALALGMDISSYTATAKIKRQLPEPFDISKNGSQTAGYSIK